MLEGFMFSCSEFEDDGLERPMSSSSLWNRIKKLQPCKVSPLKERHCGWIDHKMLTNRYHHEKLYNLGSLVFVSQVFFSENVCLNIQIENLKFSSVKSYRGNFGYVFSIILWIKG